MRKIINSTYITLDGVIGDPQDWPDNGIEGDGTGLKVQMDLLDELRLWVHPLFFGRATADSLLFRPSVTTQLELADTLALNTGTVILTYRVPAAS